MSSIRLELSTPDDDDRPLFVSGNFCDWQPNAVPFQLQKTGPGRYFIELPADLMAKELLEYKYTRGGGIRLN